MFFTRRFFVVLAAVFVLFVVGYIFPVCFEAARWLICILLSLLAIDFDFGKGVSESLFFSSSTTFCLAIWCLA